MTRHNTHLDLLAVGLVCLAVATAGGSEPIFPDAVGFGTNALAGRGGRIIRVTNLNAKGPSSLRAAVEAKGARIVVFEVGGVIDLNRDNISITEPFLTVAGQTAPSPGVTLIRGGISIESEWRDQPVKPRNGRIVVVGNVLIKGADSRGPMALVGEKGDVYMEDNIALNADGTAADMTTGRISLLDRKPVWPDDLQPLSAEEVADYVVGHAGARPRDRDAIDRRIIQDFLDRKGRIINSQEEVEGYPRHKMTHRPLDIPDHVVQSWLARMAAQVE